MAIVESARCAIKALVFYYASLAHYWLRPNATYSNCPFFKDDLHAKTMVYGIALLLPLWSKPHYRHPSFQTDLVTNLRNVAVPGTGLPLSYVTCSRFLLVPFLLVAYPVLCILGALVENTDTLTRSASGSVSFADCISQFFFRFRQLLVNPQHWFGFWRLNCHAVSLHSLMTNAAGYTMENKWDFLVECEKRGIAISPFMKEPKALVIKDRNEEGGMGICQFENAFSGGDWIIQEKLENSSFLSELLPENAPLSTFRLITASNKAAGSDGGIKTLSCVFRAGMRNASTDHKSVMFDVDMDTGAIKLGTTNTHWYRLGLFQFDTNELSVGHDLEMHPDNNIQMTGVTIPVMQEMKELCERAHAELMDDVPLCGWDVALTDDGPMLLEVNISCNFFRGTFDQDYYFNYMDKLFRHCDALQSEIVVEKKEA